MAKSKGKSRSTQVRSKLAIQVGERIRKTRKQEGLSIENFALRCDIHPSYVGHAESDAFHLGAHQPGFGNQHGGPFQGHRYTDQCGERCNTTSISGHKRVVP